MGRSQRGQRNLGTQLAPTLSDPKLQTELEANGFVVVPVVDPDALDAIHTFLASMGPPPGDPGIGLFNDSWSTSPAYKRDLASGIEGIVGSSVHRYFRAHRSLIWGTSVKHPGPQGRVVAHRDPTFVDEQRFRSVGVWCAIENLSEREGVLRVRPGSHRHSGAIRVHQSEANLYPSVDANVETDTVVVPLRAGEAIIYDHSLIHCSGPNRGDRPRVVLTAQLVPEQARSSYTVFHGDSRHTFDVDSDFFFDNKVDELDIEYVVSAYEGTEVRAICAGSTSFLRQARESMKRRRPSASILGKLSRNTPSS